MFKITALKVITVFPLLVLCACATGAQPNIHIADAAQVANCRLLGDVQGSSPFHGVFSGPAEDAARKAALKEVDNTGATDLVWQPVENSGSGTTVKGSIYDCGARPQ